MTTVDTPAADRLRDRLERLRRTEVELQDIQRSMVDSLERSRQTVADRVATLERVIEEQGG